MASDFVIVIDTIQGESKKAGYESKGGIEVSSFSWGVSNAGSMSMQGGGGSGKAVFQDLHFTKPADKASPDLMINCAAGSHIKEATLYVHKSGGEQKVFYTVKLSDLLVSSYTSGGSDEIMESVSLNFAKIEFGYSPQKADGTLDAENKKKFDLKLGKA